MSPGIAKSLQGASRRLPSGRLGSLPYDPRLQVYNLHQGNFAKWRKALAKARAGTASARLNVGVNSIDFGQFATPTAYQGGYVARLRSLLNTEFAATPGTGVSWCWATYRTDDTRVTYTNATQTAGFGPHQNSAVAISSGSSITFAPGIACDGFTVYYIGQSVTGKSFTMQIDSGAALTVNTQGFGANTATSASITGASGTHTLSITGVVGPCYIVGFEATMSTAFGIITTAVGYPGSKVSSYNLAATDASASGYQFMTNLAPNLTVIHAGENEYLSSQVITTYNTDLATAITRAKATGDVLLVTSVPNQTTTGSQASYDQMMWTVAEAQDVPVWDLAARWGTRAADTGIYYDSTHPNNAGYYDMAYGLYRVLMS